MEKVSIKDKITELEKEISSTKYNKATQHHIGLVKAKIAHLKEKQESRSSGGKKGEGYSLKKSGDATVILLGFPSVGKSTLLNALTNAKSPVGSYDFTTLTVIPGTLHYKHAKIQILDVPGIVSGAASGRGRGKEVLAVIRNADLILILIDALQPQQSKKILKEVFDTKVRINQDKPDVRITKQPRGGIRIGKTVKLDIKDETITGILREFSISNADILIRDKINEDQLIDVIEGNRSYIPSLTVLNKTDLLDKKSLDKVKKDLKPDLIISAQKKVNINKLKAGIYKKLNFIRIFLKEINQAADMEEPLIVKKGFTIGDVCRSLHKDFVSKFKHARLWGPSAKFPGQKFQKLDKLLKDEDVLEIHLK
ncbi:MAG: GTP-binding protein [Candidatus Woesearchaeota archaeon]|jgi:small GTP-binding protein|nr:GTP-binding protein [Candidatus Woesearchaeota archaeon]